MASLRQRFKVSWDDGPEVEVATTVLDIITAYDMLPKGRQNLVAVNSALLFCALRRHGNTDLPATYDDWLLVLDNYEEMPGPVPTRAPTNGAASPKGPLSSPALQEQTGAPGLTKTTEPSSQPKTS